MSLIHSRIRQIRNRLLLMQFITFTVRGLFLGLCLVAFYTLFIKFIPLDVDFYHVVFSILAAAVVASLAAALYFRPSLLQAAIAGDGFLGLRERISSAYTLTDETMPMVSELHEDAESHAQKIDLSRSFRPRFPRESYMLIFPLLVTILISTFIKEVDIFKRRQSIAERNYVQKKIGSEIKRLENAAVKLREESEKYESEQLLKAAQNIEDTVKDLQAGKFKKKQVMAKLTKLSDRINEIRDEMDKTKNLENVLKETSRLAMSKDFAEAINKGDFSAAKDALKKMQEAAGAGEMSKSQMQQMADEMKSLSEAMAESAELKQLSEALAKMADMLASQAQTGSQSAEGLAGALSEMSQLAELSLDDLQSIKEQLDALAGAGQSLGEAKMGMLDDYELYYFAMGENRGMGPGMGGPGVGMGGSTGTLGNPPVDFVDENLGGELDPKAPMLVSVTVRGPGDAEEMLKTDYSEVLPSFEQEAEAALEKEEIPPAYKEYVRQYFEDLKKR